MFRRRSIDVPGSVPGERVLATAATPTGTMIATTRRLMLPGAADAAGEPGVAVEWSEVETAAWDRDDQTLVITLVSGTGERPRRRRVAIDEPGRLLDVVRERVTASVIISRRVAISGRQGVRVTGRRTWRDEIVWSATLDAGVDLDDPMVRQRVDDAVALVRSEVE